MAWRLIGLVLTVVAVASSCVPVTRQVPKNNDDGMLDGMWLLTGAEIDDLPVLIDDRLLLEIKGNEFSADTTCNGVGGVFGGQPGASAQMLCGFDPIAQFDPMAVELAMSDTLRSGPRLVDGELVFRKGTNRFVYQRADDPKAIDLFSVLGDDSKVANHGELRFDPEGGPPPERDRLVRLDHSGSDLVFHLGTDGNQLCFHHSTDTTGGWYCQPRRELTHFAAAIVLDHSLGPSGPRAALIPDHITNAVADHPELGQLENNVLLIPDGGPSGEHELQADNGDVFVIDTTGL